MNGSGKAFSAVLASLIMVASGLAVVATFAAPTAAAAPPSGPAPAVTAAPAPAAVTSAGITPAGGAPCTTTVASENVEDSALQTAIDDAGAGTVICIGAGSWPEQLTISTPDLTLRGAGNGSLGTVIDPTSFTLNTYDYDASAGPTGTPTAAIILVEGASGTPTTGVAGVTLEDLQVDGAAAASSPTFHGCTDGLVGIDYQASSGDVNGVTVTGIELAPDLFGCQQGLAIYAYDGIYNFPTANVPDEIAVANTTVTAYDKNGITCDDSGVECALADDTVTGIGPTTLIAQNGVQIGFGASAAVTDSHVSANDYSPTANVNYWSANEANAACGILVYDAGNTLVIDGNVLSGNTQGISVLGTASGTVDGNRVVQGDAYGITFDLNASINYLYYPVYSTATPWETTASDNIVDNVNVGILVYDDNVTISGGSMADVNVSVESMVDFAGATYTVSVEGVSASVDDSGLLLGNTSSYQTPTASLFPKLSGDYVTDNNRLTVGAGAPETGAAYGIAFGGATVSSNEDDLTGFNTGIFANPTVTSATVTNDSIVAPTATSAPSTGIWIGNLAPNPSTETPGNVWITTTTVTGPGGTTCSPFAGSTGIVVGGDSVGVFAVNISGYSGVYGTCPGPTSGSGSGYDWYQGTQSVGVLIGCASTSTSCTVGSSQLTDNAIGIAVVSSNAAFSETLQTSSLNIQLDRITNSGSYGIWTEMSGSGNPAEHGNGFGAPGMSLIQRNVITNRATGAPAMVLTGGNFTVYGNVLAGTNVSGTQGPTQVMAPSIATTTIEAVDEPVAGVTHVYLDDNVFEETVVHYSNAYTAGSGSTFDAGEFVTFTESGLALGTAWSVEFGQALGTATAPGAVFGQALNQSTAFSVPTIPGYQASPASGVVHVAGAPVVETISFSLVQYGVTFTETGLAGKKLAKDGWTVSLDGQTEHSTSTSILFGIVTGADYPVLITGPSHEVVSSTTGLTGTNPDRLSVSGNTLVAVAFAPGKTVSLSFHEKGVKAGSTWCVSLDAAPLCGKKATQKFLDLTPGTYDYAVVTPAHNVTVSLGRSPWATSGPIVLTKAASLTATYLYTYRATFTESGLSGGSWSVKLKGHTETEPSTEPIVFLLGNGTWVYKIGKETGYAAAGTPSTVTVLGAGVRVAVEFTASHPAEHAVSGSPAVDTPRTVESELSGGVPLAGLGVGALLAALVAGFFRRSREDRDGGDP